MFSSHVYQLQNKISFKSINYSFGRVVGVYIFLFNPPPPTRGGWAKIWPNKMLGKKNDGKGMKKGGEMHIFSPIDKKYAYFFPQLTTNLQNSTKKSLKNLYIIIIKFHLGKKYKSRSEYI